MGWRECAQCDEVLDDVMYTNSQWRKGEGSSRCKNCTQCASEDSYKRFCISCGEAKMHIMFSRRQWAKGVGDSKCMDCVGSGSGVSAGDLLIDFDFHEVCKCTKH